MSYLSYISDNDLEAAVRFMLNSASDGLQKAKQAFSRNVIDPFSITFEMTCFNIPTVSLWESAEQSRQAQNSLVQAVGEFHQIVLGNVAGWSNRGVGNLIDLECNSRKIIAEIKNKHNTVTGAKLVGVYDDLYHLVMPNASIYHGYTAYYVEIIPKSKQGYDIEFTPSDRSTSAKRHPNPKIRKIDGKRFYYMVTGIPDALLNLYEVLPEVIANVSEQRLTSEEIAKMKVYFNAAYS